MLGAAFISALVTLPCMFISVAIDGFLSVNYPGLLHTPYDQMRLAAKDRIRRRELVHARMLAMMQYSRSFPKTMRKIEDLIFANRQLHPERYAAFLAWYRCNIDYLRNYEPEEYQNLVLRGIIRADNDPYYRENAPGWAPYELLGGSDIEEDENEDNDDFYPGAPDGFFN